MQPSGAGSSNRVTVTCVVCAAAALGNTTARRSAASTSRLIGRLATYFLPARTITVFFLTKSRTDTRPRTTRVSVDLQLSSTSHLVPTTVAALCLPFVRNLPLPSPQSRRFFFFLAAAIALPAFGQLSFSTNVRTVIGLAPLVCVSRKMPA